MESQPGVAPPLDMRRSKHMPRFAHVWGLDLAWVVWLGYLCLKMKRRVGEMARQESDREVRVESKSMQRFTGTVR
jgi:hypothetical protein